MHYLRMLKAERKTMGAFTRNLKKEEKKVATSLNRMEPTHSAHEHFCTMASELFRTRMTNRFMSRHAHLAHAYIKGMAYKVAENSAKEVPSAEEIANFVVDFGWPEMRNKTLEVNTIEVTQWISQE